MFLAGLLALNELSLLATIIGSTFMAIGYTVAIVAVIAYGVRLGFRHVDWERQQRV